MDYNKLDILLNKYYNGESSLEEEKMLWNFFKNDGFSSELREEKMLFDSFNKIRNESIPEPELKNELLVLIDQSWKESTKVKFQKIKRWSVSVAAILVIGISVYFNYNQTTTVPQDTFADEQQAYEATKQVLMYISETMNSESVKLADLARINTNFNSLTKLKNVEKAINDYKLNEK